MQANKTSGQFTLALLEFKGVTDEAAHEKISEIGKELITSSKKILTGSNDVILRTSETEMFFVVVGWQKFSQVKKVINKVLAANGCNSKDSPFECKLGAAVYPDDSSEVIEIENLARLRAGDTF